MIHWSSSNVNHFFAFIAHCHHLHMKNKSIIFTSCYLASVCSLIRNLMRLTVAGCKINLHYLVRFSIITWDKRTVLFFFRTEPVPGEITAKVNVLLKKQTWNILQSELGR